MRDKSARCEIKMRGKKCKMRDKNVRCEMRDKKKGRYEIEYCEIPGQAPWSRNLTKKGKAKVGRTDSQRGFCGCVA